MTKFEQDNMIYSVGDLLRYKDAEIVYWKETAEQYKKDKEFWKDLAEEYKQINKELIKKLKQKR